MNNFEKKLKNIITETRLTTDEKDIMRERIHDYMQHVPTRLTQDTASVSRFYSVLVSYRTVAVFLVVTLMFTSGVGVSYASVDALPGEYLYPIKEVSEEVRTQLIRDEGEKAQWMIERAHRRLAEAQLLAQVGRLNDETASKVEERFIKHTDRALARIEALRERQPALAEALALSFETGAEAHVETLEEEDSDVSTEESVESFAVAEQIAPLAAVDVQTAEKRVGDRRDSSQRRRIARLARAHIGLPQLIEERAAATARVFKADVSVTPVDPEVTEELVKVLTDQQKRLEERADALSEERKKRLRAVLDEVRTQRDEIVKDIGDGEHREAKKKLRDVIKATHKTDSAIKTGKPLRPFTRPIPKVDTQDL